MWCGAVKELPQRDGRASLGLCPWQLHYWCGLCYLMIVQSRPVCVIRRGKILKLELGCGWQVCKNNSLLIASWFLLWLMVLVKGLSPCPGFEFGLRNKAWSLAHLRAAKEKDRLQKNFSESFFIWAHGIVPLFKPQLSSFVKGCH